MQQKNSEESYISNFDNTIFEEGDNIGSENSNLWSETTKLVDSIGDKPLHNLTQFNPALSHFLFIVLIIIIT